MNQKACGEIIRSTFFITQASSIKRGLLPGFIIFMPRDNNNGKNNAGAFIFTSDPLLTSISGYNCLCSTQV
jgi:hypothetical protein